MNKWLTIVLAILLLVAVFVFANFVGRSPMPTDVIDVPNTSNTPPEQEQSTRTSNPIVPKLVESGDASGTVRTEAPSDNSTVITRPLRIEEKAVSLPLIESDPTRESGAVPGSRLDSTETSLPGSGVPRLTSQGPGTGQTLADTQFIDMDLTPIGPNVIDDGPGDPIRMSPAPGPGEGFQDVPGLGPGEGYQGVPGPGPGENDFGVPGPGPGEVESVVPEPGPEADGGEGNEPPQGN